MILSVDLRRLKELMASARRLKISLVAFRDASGNPDLTDQECVEAANDLTATGGKTSKPAVKPKANASKPGSLSAFIRARPNDTPKDIVEAAEKEGLKIKRNLIYNIRSTDKMNRAKESKKVKKVKTEKLKPIVPVKDQILGVLKKNPGGLTLGEIASALKVNKNRVRAVLPGLNSEHKVHVSKEAGRGSVWFTGSK